MESLIDQRYRLELIQYCLEGYEMKQGKEIFFCPLCQFDRPKTKYVQKKGGMFWKPQWNAWRFNCAKCLPLTSMYRFLEKVNPELAKRYQRERWISGTTGWGHDCPSPNEQVLDASTPFPMGASSRFGGVHRAMGAVPSPRKWEGSGGTAS